MLEIMLPAIFPVQAQIHAPVAVPVVVNLPPVVNVPLVAAGVQQLVGQVQDLIIQHVAVVQPSIEMEVGENENEIFKRLFLKRFGRELPEQERSDVDDINMNLIDLTKEDDEDEMEVATPAAVVVVVKTESIETPETPEAPEVAPIDDRRRSSRLGRLRKSDVIQEKEAPLAASNVIADTDTDMAEDTSVGSVNAVESVNTESGNTMTYEETMAAIDAAIEASQRAIDEFDE